MHHWTKRWSLHYWLRLCLAPLCLIDTDADDKQIEPLNLYSHTVMATLKGLCKCQFLEMMSYFILGSINILNKWIYRFISIGGSSPPPRVSLTASILFANVSSIPLEISFSFDLILAFMDHTQLVFICS